MNLLSSLSTLNSAANCQENWQIVTREREYRTLTLGHLAIAGTGGEMQGVEMQGTGGECSILSSDTIVSISADPSKTLDRFLGLPLRPDSINDSINESFSEIASQMKNYRHESESERLFVGLNPQPPSGRYGPKPKVPQ